MDTSKISRIEVINHAVPPESEEYGRAYVYWPENKKITVRCMLQDDDRTLKIFIS